MDESALLKEPEFHRLLVRRSRLRWGFSGLLIGAYLVWGIGGLYYAEAYATPLAGSAFPAGLAMGLLIIALSIVFSIIYVRAVNRIEAEEFGEQEKHR
jgi:uncharacterized membrane protein (DUF485 family)